MDLLQDLKDFHCVCNNSVQVREFHLGKQNQVCGVL
jgi:hypothetical protein